MAIDEKNLASIFNGKPREVKKSNDGRITHVLDNYGNWIPIEELIKFKQREQEKIKDKKINSINHPPLQQPEDVDDIKDDIKDDKKDDKIDDKIDDIKDDIKDDKVERIADYKVTYTPKVDVNTSTKVPDRVKIVGTKNFLEEYMDLLYWYNDNK